MARVRTGAIIGQAHAYWPSYMASRLKAHSLQAWNDGKQYHLEVDQDSPLYGRPFSPTHTEDEYDDLASRTPTPWAGLVTKAVAQTAYLEGVRMPKSQDNMEVWSTWQRNRMDARQIPIHRAAIAHGAAFGTVLPGKDFLTGDKLPKMQGKSALQMAAFYDNEDDEWADLAIEADPYRTNDGEVGWNVRLYDDVAVHFLTCKNNGSDIKDWKYISYDEHPLKVTPVARCANFLSLEGIAMGEIEPILPLLRRIDQDTFDRLIVQRFGAWKIRYIAGMAKPSDTQQANMQALKLRVEDLLISSNKDTKFGTLDATSTKDFIEAHDSDLRVLSAITQTPPHHLLGLSSNLQAEALAAAEAGLQRKSFDFRQNAGEFWEQMFRMSATITGNVAEARAFDMQVRWRDTESRSMTQAADALGKLAVQLKVPLEMLWEKIPGWSDGDTERAKTLVENGAMEQLIAALNQQLDGGQGQGQGQPGDGGE